MYATLCMWVIFRWTMFTIIDVPHNFVSCVVGPVIDAVVWPLVHRSSSMLSRVCIDAISCMLDGILVDCYWTAPNPYHRLSVPSEWWLVWRRCFGGIRRCFINSRCPHPVGIVESFARHWWFMRVQKVLSIKLLHARCAISLASSKSDNWLRGYMAMWLCVCLVVHMLSKRVLDSCCVSYLSCFCCMIRRITHVMHRRLSCCHHHPMRSVMATYGYVILWVCFMLIWLDCVSSIIGSQWMMTCMASLFRWD